MSRFIATVALVAALSLVSHPALAEESDRELDSSVHRDEQFSQAQGERNRGQSEGKVNRESEDKGSEDQGRDKFRLGFQVGGNVSNPRVEGNADATAQGGLWGGAILESNLLGRYITLQTELNYVQKPGQGSADNVDLAYLELPLHAKLKLNIADIRTFVQAGPSVGYLVSVSNNTGNRNFNNLDVNLDIGAGLAFFLGDNQTNEFFIAGRYSTGIRDVDNGTDNWKTEGVRLALGMLF